MNTVDIIEYIFLSIAVSVGFFGFIKAIKDDKK